MDNKPSDKKLTAKITKVTPEYKGFLTINKVEIEKELHEGGTKNITWLVMDRGHAVGVLGYDPRRDEIVLVNEMRPGILWTGDYPYTDNVIAGGINKDETALEAAVRETKEEAGLDLVDPILVHPGAYVSSGGTSERIAIVVGIIDTSKAGGIHGCPNESENIKTTILKAEDFFKQIESGAQSDLKTIVAGNWLEKNRPALRLKYAPETVAKLEEKKPEQKKPEQKKTGPAKSAAKNFKR